MDDSTTSTAHDVGTEARSVDAGRGLGWWTDAWALFTRSALLWVALGVILIVGFGVIGMVPVIGSLAMGLLLPVFLGSWMLAARKVEGGGALDLADLFACFQGERLTPLLVLGALMMAGMLLIGVVAGVLGLGAVFGMVGGGMHRSATGVMTAVGAGMVALLVVLVLVMAVTMALWFAPALVVFRNAKPLDALRASFGATLKNTVPLLVYGLLYIVASIVATIPFGLGWLVLVPLSLLTAYVSYQDVFGE